MGNRYREPRPLSPERLSLKSINSVKHEDYAVEVQATFLFDPYTPDWEGELSRAVVVLSKLFLTVLSALSVSVNASPARNTQGLVTTIPETVLLWRNASMTCSTIHNME